MSLLFVLAAITVAFIILLLIKVSVSWRFCAICLAVSLTWLGLLIAYHSGQFNNGLLLALLMGQSVAGIYYLLEKRAPRRWLVFRLPAILSLTALFYSGLTLDFYWPAWSLLAALWSIAGVIYAYRTRPKLKLVAKKLIACCGDW